MNDGNTGFHVAPITEDDMSKVTSILKRAADAIVGMSQLAADVDMLRQTVSSLQADADRLRNQNAALDEALAHSRTVRDDQARELADTKAKLVQVQSEADSFSKAHLHLQDDYNTIYSQLEQAKKDRDEAGYNALDLADKLKAAEAKLAKIAEAHASVFGQAMLPVSPPVTISNREEPIAPHPVQASGEPATPLKEVDFAKPYHWDDKTSQYVNDPEPDGASLSDTFR